MEKMDESSVSIESLVGKIIVIDFYDRDEDYLEEHIIGRLEKYDAEAGKLYFEKSYSWAFNEMQIDKVVDDIEIEEISKPSALEMSLYDKVLHGMVWVS